MGAVMPLRGVKRRALLTYLVLNSGQAMHRNDLADMFWPGVDQRKARASLRQALTDLRKIIGADILRSDTAFVTAIPAEITTDIAQLQTTLAENHTTAVELSALRALPSIFRGFEGIGEVLDEWLRDTRARLFTQVIDSAEKRLQDTSLGAEMQLRLARAMLELDDLNEIAIRGQISALAALNDNSAALRAYHAFYERIEQELAVEPSIETQELAVKIKLLAGPEHAALVPATPATGSARPLTLVAVMPFDRLGTSDIPDHVILGVLDQITCKMAINRSPAVISSNSTRQYLGTNTGVIDVAKSLDARYVVTGSIAAQADSVVLSVQLCDGVNGRIHWANSRSMQQSSLFEGSLQLADDIARAIEPSLNLAELDRAHHISPDALEPHHLVLRAKDLIFSLARDKFGKARDLLDRALQIGPAFAPAHALSAEWYAISLWQGWSHHPQSEVRALETHARQAIRLSPGDGRAMAQWGHHTIALERDFDTALALFDKALDLCPSDSETLIWTVPTLAHCGQTARALRNGMEAFRLSPVDPFLFRNEHFLSLARYANGEYDEASRLGLASFKRAPSYGSNLRVTVASLAAAGRQGEARDLAAHHNMTEPTYSLAQVKDKMGFLAPDTQDLYVTRLLDAGITA